MKIRLVINPHPKIGATRIRTRFLWFPRWIGGEIRWLETATYQQTWVETPYRYYWEDIRWVLDAESEGGRSDRTS